MYYQTIEDTFQYLAKLPKGNLLEFGVFNGNTMNRLINGMKNAGEEFTNIHGFDSFVGLPKETNGIYHNPDWPERAFSLSDTFSIASIDEAVEFVRSNIQDKNVVLHPGFFSKSLTPELGEELKDSTSYAHVDADIYISTWQVLDWLFTYKILKRGAIIRYDDWVSTPEYKGGNSLAHVDAVRKHRVILNRLSVNVFQYLG